jgi:hypothetical protein
MKPSATPTSATYEDFVELYGKETMCFGTSQGRSYHWFGEVYVVLNVWDDGTRSAYETTPTVLPSRQDWGTCH